ncbi:sigma factor-like helix-turn-helix DNA-binding protein [Blastococcus sp. TF02A-26]|uniref:sigma factor-like helix-turn-helix DNA-binding protein n=1 Tax=Blastococcus sp. TF02A-26 TaxID=2250577 RepID=UPI000E1495D7|nr:sigma factor-like helix-turn-helix DNA-binding protein [Blastococcus sp. TF02A-26]RBY87507.1 hypothetical protein DQ240_07985 [Blastococcus sp. TF02A-26]
MERERRRDAADLVRDHGPGLLRTTVLLTGDRASAEDLVLTAATGVRRSTDDPAAALRALVIRTFLSRRRLLDGEQVVEGVRPDADRDPAYARAAELRAALLQLAPRTRAALVLRVAEGLDAEQTARLVRSEPGSIEADVHDAVTALRPLLSPRASHPSGADDTEELRARLHALADELTWLDPAVPVEGVAARIRRRRRTRVASAGAVAAAAALLIGVPAVLGPAPAREGTGTEPATEARTPEQAAAAAAAVQAQLEDAVARIGAAPVLTSPAEWDQWLPRGRPPEGTTGQEDEGTCPPLSDRLTAALDAPMGYWTGALPRGPVGCTWVPSPGPLSAGGPYDYPYVLSVGFVHDRDGTSVETLRSTFAPGGPGSRTLCPSADLPGESALIGCPDEEGRTDVRLLLAVRDARDAGVWVLSARVQPQTGRSPADALAVLTEAVSTVYG